MSYSIIIPTFNESENIVLLIEHIYNHIDDNRDEVIIIDDNSPDNTSKFVSNLLQKYSSLQLLCRREERGLRSALQNGIDMAKNEYIIWMDADFSHHPDYIPSLIHETKDCDVCICSRFIPNSLDERKINIQKILSIIINKLCNRVFNNKVTDWTSGFICLRREIFNHLSLKGHYGDYFIYLLADLIKKNYTIKEIPYQTKDRIYGTSKSSPNIKSLIYNGYYYLKAITLLFIKQ